MAPEISVLLPAFNSESYLAEATHSILNQTFEDLELLIIDDGSTDRTREIAASISQQDSRVIVIGHNDNRGIGPRMNEGITLAKGEYIARMDADDVSVPDRFQLQVDYLKEHPDVALVGGFIRLFGGRRKCIIDVATDPHHIRWRLLFGNSMGNVTVMGRRALFEDLGGYDETLKVAGDYDLWLRVNWRWHMANIPRVLVNVREDPASTSRRLSPERQRNALGSLNKAQRDFLDSDIPLGVTMLSMSPTSLREDETLREAAPAAAELIHRLAVAYLDTVDLSEADRRKVIADARHKLAQLTLLQKGESRRLLLGERRTPLLRRRDLVITTWRYLRNKVRMRLGRC